MKATVSVIGSGSFGTCLAMLCAREHDVLLWSRDETVAETINQDHRNPKYLSEFSLPEHVQATTDLSEAISDKEMVIFAVPSHGMRHVVSQAASDLDPDTILVTAAKGIEPDTGFLVHEIFEDVLPKPHHPRVVALSGPSFAREIAAHKPTVVTLASHEETFAISVQSTLSCEWFRCYSHDDLLGVELGGALKNVVAIAVGIADGLELGSNARAAIMTRGLAEISRLGVKMGADPLTFLGLSGMGDLVLTCTGDLSRNRSVGLELGRGKRLSEILGSMNQVAEGVRTARSAQELAEKYDVDMPIIGLVSSVLDNRVTALEAVRQLMTRQLRSEME